VQILKDSRFTVNDAVVRHLAFIIRCAVAATMSYLAAREIGLDFPAWAAISGLIVSQDRVHETRHAMRERFIGTIIGIVVAVVSSALLARTGFNVAAQMAVAVGICAAVARRYRKFRVCMWTCPTVFFTAVTTTPIFMVGLDRGLEVIIGGAIAGLLHIIFDNVALTAMGLQSRESE
jgi:uncharacterized membrane protein YgaE (UPF0421/DUF939 family)